ncbi:MAG: N-acetylmuramoyl-L-alanine amidase [Anaerolineae bacterium]|nr:N-acetylmuramoyl-L-alanine amidase [Anaerolineae bacterium]
MSLISRREFIKISSLQIAAALLPSRPYFSSSFLNPWPQFHLEQLPRDVLYTLQLVPDTEIDAEGYLYHSGDGMNDSGRVTLAPTEWSQENSLPSNLLFENNDWGIVLHWFGDREHHDLDIAGYLQGFNGEQVVDGKQLRTSSHFLVGDDPVATTSAGKSDSLSIVQTQRPGPYGRPFVSSHLLPSPFQTLSDPRHYFVRAMEEVLFYEPAAYSILQEISQNTKLDPNMVTLSIEIVGYEFDGQQNYPSATKIANVVSVVWAIMKRYRIPALNILGHLEINLEKPDPGKKFLSLIRFLIGVKALVSSDDQMKELVFSPFNSDISEPNTTIWKYFNFVREYLLLISDPKTVYEWESESKYWFIQDMIMGTPRSRGRLAASAHFPLGWLNAFSPASLQGFPEDEGIDIPAGDPGGKNKVKLMAHGECVYRGAPKNSKWGKTAIFRHREHSGAEVVSVYSDLDRFQNLEIGKFYDGGSVIGEIDSPVDLFDKSLRFSIAYAATWEKDLQQNLTVPENAGQTWIGKRFIDPSGYIKARTFYRKIDEKRLELKLLRD